jgi:hypothetical protein
MTVGGCTDNLATVAVWPVWMRHAARGRRWLIKRRLRFSRLGRGTSSWGASTQARERIKRV